MPKAVFAKLQHTKITPILMCLQLADQSLCYPIGIVEDTPVNIRGFFIPVNFVILEIHLDSKVSLILEGPFLSTVNAHISASIGEVKFNFNGREERFPFRSRPKLT